jgi:iron-sulfur cluster repair protein YtfE (RIC family)
MDAITLIKKDHDKVEELFARYNGGGGLTGLVKRITGNVPVRQKTTALEGICRELDVHARIEEDILYPALRKTGDPELQRQVDESIREHARVKDLVGKLRTRTGELDADTDAMVSELQQCVEHHVREEENEMFPRMEEVVPEPERRELGRQLQERKRTLAGGTARRARPAARGRTRTAGVRRSTAKKTTARPRKKRARR